MNPSTAKSQELAKRFPRTDGAPVERHAMPVVPREHSIAEIVQQCCVAPFGDGKPLTEQGMTAFRPCVVAFVVDVDDERASGRYEDLHFLDFNTEIAEAIRGLERGIFCRVWHVAKEDEMAWCDPTRYGGPGAEIVW